jgi:hypothetical protein
MRRPVDVNCVRHFSLPGWQKSLAGEEHVKAERSEFILSLDGGRAGDIEVYSGKGKRRTLLCDQYGHMCYRVNTVATLPSALDVSV